MGKGLASGPTVCPLLALGAFWALYSSLAHLPMPSLRPAGQGKGAAPYGFYVHCLLMLNFAS